MRGGGTGIELSLYEIYKAITPVFSKQYWFFSCYILLYLVSPLINNLLNNIGKRTHLTVIIIGFVLFSLIDSLLITKDPFYISRGKNLIWFIYLYITSAYIRLYVPLNDKKYKYLIFSILLIAATTASYYILYWANISKIENDKLISLVSVTIFLASLFLFMFFRNVKIKNEVIKRILVFLSPLTFGVYLIHDNESFRKILWDFVKPERYADSLRLWLLLLVTVPTVYIVCAVVEFLRQKLFKLFKVEKLSDYLSQKILKLCSYLPE